MTFSKLPLSGQAPKRHVTKRKQEAKKTSVRSAIADNGAPRKPKRPLSAYNLFFQAERAKSIDIARKQDVDAATAGAAAAASASAADANSNTGAASESCDGGRSRKGAVFQNLARHVAARWNALPDEQRTTYEEQAAQEKVRYDREMAEWMKSSSGGLAWNALFGPFASGAAPDAATAPAGSNDFISSTASSRSAGRGVLTASHSWANASPMMALRSPPPLPFASTTQTFRASQILDASNGIQNDHTKSTSNNFGVNKKHESASFTAFAQSDLVLPTTAPFASGAADGKVAAKEKCSKESNAIFDFIGGGTESSPWLSPSSMALYPSSSLAPSDVPTLSSRDDPFWKDPCVWELLQRLGGA